MVSVAQELYNAGFFIGLVIYRLSVRLQEKSDILPKGSIEDLDVDIGEAVIRSFLKSPSAESLQVL